MKKVGITGGIGCGKTTVMEAFRLLGIPCFVADEVAGHYYDDPAFCDKVARLLGDTVRVGQGVDKRRIAHLVFADTTLLAALNAMVHPRVLHDFENFAIQQQAPYALFESAILFDHGIDKMMDATICVYLDTDERLRRLVARDHVPEEALLQRMSRQLPAEVMMQRADYVILNYEGNPRRRQVRHVHEALLARFAGSPGC